jgi:hypothetical protein
MNQSILFPDIQHWDETTQFVRFPAQQAGALIECKISLASLVELNKNEFVETNAKDIGQRALEVFAQARFDIEELAEALIEDEAFDQFGEVQISSS